MDVHPRTRLLAPPQFPELAREPQAAETLAEGFHALADPRRLQLLHLLLTRDALCVCELLRVVQATPSNRSFHLNALRQAGFIRARKQGRWASYAAERERLAAFPAAFCHRFDPAQSAIVHASPVCCENGATSSEALSAE